MKSSSPKSTSNLSCRTPSPAIKTVIKHHSNHRSTKYSTKATTEHIVTNYANELTHTTNDATDETALQSLMFRLQEELRRAKSQHLACTEVLLPSDLLNRIASEMVVMSEKEPCGIRGSTIYIEFEDEPNNTR